MGYLYRQIEPKLKEIFRNKNEIKHVIYVSLFLIWGDFVYNYKSFWLVQNNIGNGLTDVIASICACYAIIIVSKYMDKKIKYISPGLAFLGKHSLLMLSIHIIELKFFPWNALVGNSLALIVVAKFIWIIGLVLILHKLPLICNIYGYETKLKS